MKEVAKRLYKIISDTAINNETVIEKYSSLIDDVNNYAKELEKIDLTIDDDEVNKWLKNKLSKKKRR